MDSTVFKYPIASLMILCFLPEPTISEGLTYEEMNTLSKYEEKFYQFYMAQQQLLRKINKLVNKMNPSE